MAAPDFVTPGHAAESLAMRERSLGHLRAVLAAKRLFTLMSLDDCRVMASKSQNTVS
jgi:hypothetical protein